MRVARREDVRQKGERMQLQRLSRFGLSGPVWLIVGFLLASVVSAGGVVGAKAVVPDYTGPHPRTPVDQIPPGGEMQNFTLVGHNPLLDQQTGLPRGQNGGIAAVRDCLYVGTNIGLQPTVIVDMADMSNPTLVGPLPGGIAGRGSGVEGIEAVPDLNLLVNTVRTSGALGFDPPVEDTNAALLVYDVSDCRHPVLAGRWDAPNVDLHYMNLWRDPNQSDRVLANVTFSNAQPDDGIDIRVIDLTGCPKSCNPRVAAEWGLRAQYEIPPFVDTTYDGGTYHAQTQTHDVTSSLDGTRMYVAQLHFGYFELDSTALGKNQPCDASSPRSPDATGHCLTVLNSNLNTARVIPFGVGAGHTHGIVRLPGRPYVSMAHESADCPWAGIDMVYVGNQEQFLPGGPGTGLIRGDLMPRVVGTFSIPENQLERCPQPNQAPKSNTFGSAIMRNGLFSTHNVLAFPDLMLATWYSGGLRAIDVTNPFMPFEVGYFFNKPESDLRWCGFDGPMYPYCGPIEKGADGVPVQQRPTGPPDIVARSYPIIMNGGYVVYSDANSGVYVLRYSGPHADEIPTQGQCSAHNPNVVSPGYEPCPPYAT
jgi:hypothetical protein